MLTKLSRAGTNVVSRLSGPPGVIVQVNSRMTQIRFVALDVN